MLAHLATNLNPPASGGFFMEKHMNINQATLDLVKRFEGLELTAHLDPVGVLTIGYGYTNSAGFGPGVSVGET